MKLSIIIPVFRVEDTLDRCLESVTQQSFRDFEVILVDDGSPDRCPAMCDEWAQRDNRICVIHKGNGGLSSARNAGIERAQGELITFVDSDDFIDGQTYEEVLPLMAQADIAEFPLYWHYGANEQEMRAFGELCYDDMADYWLRGRAYEHTYAWNKIYRRELFDGVRFPEGRVFEDVATLPLLLQEAKRVMTTQRGCYYYCINTEGITAKASGQELGMLLDSHLQAMRLWQDDAYYMHVLNIQMDVFERSGRRPVLSRRWVNPAGSGLDSKQRCKAVLLHLLGIKGICQFNKLTHQLTRGRL